MRSTAARHGPMVARCTLLWTDLFADSLMVLLGQLQRLNLAVGPLRLVRLRDGLGAALQPAFEVVKSSGRLIQRR